MYVRLRRVAETIVAVERKAIHITYSGCVCSLSYPAFTPHASYCIAIFGLSGCTIFSQRTVNGTIFGKKLLNKKCVLDFFDNFYLKHILRGIERVIIINIRTASCKVLIRF